MYGLNQNKHFSKPICFRGEGKKRDQVLTEPKQHCKCFSSALRTEYISTEFKYCMYLSFPVAV